METRIILKKGSILTFLLMFVMTFIGYAEEIDSAALASVTEEDKISETLSYIAMGVGIVGVVWVAYMLSNKSPNRTPSRK